MRTRHPGIIRALVALTMLLAGLSLFPRAGTCATVTFSGTVSQPGSAAGDSLYVVVLDTMGTEDVTLVAIAPYPVGTPPFDQAFTLDFENTGVGSTLFVVALLDVDGDGTNSVSGEDIFGWFDGDQSPTAVSSTASHTGLDFALPQGEIQGTLTLAPGQTEARVYVTPSVDCADEGFRPNFDLVASGPYSLKGVYAGTYCVRARGDGSNGYAVLCYGDPTCVAPTFVSLTTGEVLTGINFDFNDLVPVTPASLGSLKARYP